MPTGCGLGARKMADLKTADLKMTDQIVRKMAEMKLADLKMADEKNDRCVRRSTGRRLILGNYVRFMHRCRVRQLAKYRRQPQIKWQTVV